MSADSSDESSGSPFEASEVPKSTKKQSKKENKDVTPFTFLPSEPRLDLGYVKKITDGMRQELLKVGEFVRDGISAQGYDVEKPLQLAVAFKKKTGDPLAYDVVFRQVVTTAMAGSYLTTVGNLAGDKAPPSNRYMVFPMNDSKHVRAFERLIDDVSVTELLEGQAFTLLYHTPPIVEKMSECITNSFCRVLD